MFRFLTRIIFIVGLVIGTLLALWLKGKFDNKNVQVKVSNGPFSFNKYQEFFKNSKLLHRQIPFDILRYGNSTFLIESDFLFEKINVLCLIMAKSTKNAKAAEATWAKGCNKIELLNLNTEKRKIPSIKGPREDSSWILLCKALQQTPEEFSWVLITYDYTFALIENLRFFVAGLNPDEQYYLGHAVKFWSTIYNMGQAGYVLSRGTIKAFKRKFTNFEECATSLTYRNQEDYYLGKNLANLNITPLDTKDPNGFSTFHPYNLFHLFFPGEDYYRFSVFSHKCCSPHSITFQSIEGDKMYTYYYLLYTLQRFYHGNLGNRLPVSSGDDDKIWINFLKDRDIPANISAEQYYKIWENIVDDPTSFAKHMKREEYFDYDQ